MEPSFQRRRQSVVNPNIDWGRAWHSETNTVSLMYSPPLSVSLFYLDGAAERIRASDPRGAHAAAAAAYARGEGRARAAADHGRGARGPRGRRLGG